MNYTNGLYTITKISAPHPVDPLGNEIDIEVGFIDFHKALSLKNRSPTLDLQMKYEISESGLILVDADGRCGDIMLSGDIVLAHRMTGTIIKLRR